MPSPKPARSRGSSVHQAEASGRNASPAMPPATSRQPASAFAAGAPCTNEPPIAATGSIVISGGGRERLDTPATDQQQHEQEDNGRQRPRTRQRGAGEHVARRARQVLVDRGDRGQQRGGRRQRDRRLGDEDRAPVEQLGQRASSAGPAAVPTTAAPTHSCRSTRCRRARRTPTRAVREAPSA